MIFRNRKHSVLVRLNEQELVHLRSLVKASGLPQENLLRKIILGYQVKASPPIEYQEIIGQLMSIENSINQIAAKLNTLSVFDRNTYSDQYSELLKVILEIQNQMESPNIDHL
ncbi:MAG: hypothetical protein PHE63_11495 [Eubacteriales bacterium]|nr:hypothetical protein [Eubacteriales bacterium]